jgi:hypothetical protein
VLNLRAKVVVSISPSCCVDPRELLKLAARKSDLVFATSNSLQSWGERHSVRWYSLITRASNVLTEVRLGPASCRCLSASSHIPIQINQTCQYSLGTHMRTDAASAIQALYIELCPKTRTSSAPSSDQSNHHSQIFIRSPDHPPYMTKLRVRPSH